MARDSLANAKAELFALLTAAPSLKTAAGVTELYDHETGPRGMLKPISIAVSTAGWSPEFYFFAIRAYADVSVDARLVQTRLDALVPLVEAKLSHRWGPTQGTIQTHQDSDNILVAEWVIEVGREDF